MRQLLCTYCWLYSSRGVLPRGVAALSGALPPSRAESTCNVIAGSSSAFSAKRSRRAAKLIYCTYDHIRNHLASIASILIATNLSMGNMVHQGIMFVSPVIVVLEALALR